MRKKILILVILFVSFLTVLAFSIFTKQKKHSVQIQFEKLILPLLEKKYTAGVIVGVVNGNKTEIFSYGEPKIGSGKKPNKNTIFAIGSITKTFTSLVLANITTKKLVSLDDPITKFLPESVSVPEYENKKITLKNLATHTSALPRMPTNFKPEDFNNPYETYLKKDLYAFLNEYKLTYSPGETYLYSNVGSGLLGHILELYTGKNFQDVIKTDICTPLKMKDTTIFFSSEQKTRLSQGYDLELTPTQSWEFDVLAGAGAFYSTLEDMLIYLKAQLGKIKSPLSLAIELTHKPIHSTPMPRWDIGLGWHVNKTGDIGWHDGGTSGYYAFMGFNKQKDFGFVLLSNSTLWQIEPFGLKLEEILLGKDVTPLKLKTPIVIPTTIIQNYVGNYQIKPGSTVTITSYEDKYLVIANDQKGEAYLLYPESETKFFMLESEEVTFYFEKDDTGKAVKIITDTPEGKIEALRID